jgi:putative endonuclease
MGFYVYIIQSQVDASYYKGFSESPPKRLLQHNNGECQYTSFKLPWTLVYIEELPTKSEGLIRERVLKKYSHKQIQQLISSCKNILGNFGSSAG